MERSQLPLQLLSGGCPYPFPRVSVGISLDNIAVSFLEVPLLDLHQKFLEFE
jgi:hypothetical protein